MNKYYILTLSLMLILLAGIVYVSNSQDPFIFIGQESGSSIRGFFSGANWGAEANVTLTSPADGSTGSINPIEFNASIVVGTAAYAVNASLYTNETGTWQKVNDTAQYTQTPTDTDNAIYESFDEFDGSTIDTSKWTNSTGNAPSSVTVSGGKLRVVADAPSSGSSPGSAQATSIGLFNAGDLMTFNITSIRHTSSFAVDDGDAFIDLGSNNIFSYAFNSASEELDPIILQVFYDGSNYHYRNNTNYTGFGPWDSTGTGGQIQFRTTTVATGGFSSTTTIDLEWVRYTYPENQSWSRTFNHSVGSIIWNAQACDSDGDCGFAENNFTLNIDQTMPNITIFDPINLQDYNALNFNETLNFSVEDSGIENCWYEYNFTNITLDSCSTSGFNIANVTLAKPPFNLTVWANDSLGNTGFNTTSWEYKIFEFNRSHNANTFETSQETYSINLSSNSSLTGVNLLINTGSTTMQDNGGGNWSVSQDTNTDSLGLNNISFSFDYGGENIFSSYNTTQFISEIFLEFCNATYSVPYVNFTFKNESTAEEPVQANINSIWNFWIGSGTFFKTKTLTDTSETFNKTICFHPGNQTINTNVSLTYSNSQSQQRSFSSSPILTNSTLQQTLYLLPNFLGLFSQFQTVDLTNTPIGEVLAVITRTISGEEVTVASGLTDSSGFISFFLNPDITYTGTFSKSGFSTNTFTFVPTTDIRFVTLSGGTSINGSEISLGTDYTIFPENSSLINDTVYTFGFNVTGNEDINFISMNISNQSGFVFSFQSNSGIGFISDQINTSQNTTLIGRYEIRTSEENLTINKIWVIGNIFIGDYSIYRQGQLYLDYGFDDFWKLLIVLFTIFGLLIYMSKSELSDNAETRVGVVILIIWAFSIIGWLDNPGVVQDTGIAQFARQYSIAILSTCVGLFITLRRYFT